MQSWLDSESVLIFFRQAPKRVVSLVPSMTESLYAFGLDGYVVGISDYCLPGTPESEARPRVGGTKTPDVDKIRDLGPDLVIANREENSREAVEMILEERIPVWLTFPTTVVDAVSDLWTIARLFGREQELSPRLQLLEKTLDWTSLVNDQQRRPRFFCPIWKGENPDWWMTFNRQTYAHDLLTCCGGENIFSDRVRRFPLMADLGQGPAIEAPERDARYPCVPPFEVAAAKPEIILLPSEPFNFTQRDVAHMEDVLADTPAVAAKRIHLLDGRLITWHGIQLAIALTVLPRLFYDRSS
jgi:ABC-type Fe3+-hydroxamate transport system substrate-binding protein